MDKGTPPPIPFDELVSAEMDPELRPAAEELVRIKKDNSKYDSGSSIPELDEYIREQLKFIKEAADKAEDRRNDWDRLEEFFRSAVM
jgi:predicted nucleotidyltransferase